MIFEDKVQTNVSFISLPYMLTRTHVHSVFSAGSDKNNFTQKLHSNLD